MFKRGLISLVVSWSLGIPLWADTPVASAPASLPQSAPVAATESTQLPLPALQEGTVAPTEPSVASAEEDALEPEYVRGRSRYWGRAEFLLWWTKESDYPALLTTGDTTAKMPGAIGNAGTKVLFGGRIDFEERPGGRFTLGYGLDDDDLWSLEGSGFFLGSRTERVDRSSPGSPVLARPYFDVLANAQSSQLITFPGLALGNVSMNVDNDLWGTEANLFANVIRDERFRLDVLAGFRYLNLDEQLSILEVSTVVNPAVKFGGQTITVKDYFGNVNHFYGGQLGLRADLRESRWHLNLLAKVALGCVQEITDIHGQTSVNTNPATVFNAGFLALASNSGHFARNEFAVVPEVAAQLGFQITERCQVFAGYSFLYWSRVARPGDQIDLNLNNNQIPTSTTFGAPGGPAQPAFLARSTDFWAQGLNFGVAYRY